MESDRYKLHPLTSQEREFAEKHHNLIYGFIHRFNYSIEKHYNIAVFGYLKAVQIYHERKDLQEKYDFPFICWMYMRSEMGNHFRTEKSQCRQSENGVISLDAKYVESEDFYNTIIGDSFENEILLKELLANLKAELTESQCMIVELKIYGYTNKEVCVLMGIKTSTFYKELNRIKSIMKNFIKVE